MIITLIVMLLVYLLGVAISEQFYSSRRWGDFCPECGARLEDKAYWWPVRDDIAPIRSDY
jgi:hypothetical protein